MTTGRINQGTNIASVRRFGAERRRPWADAVAGNTARDGPKEFRPLSTCDRPPTG